MPAPPRMGGGWWQLGGAIVVRVLGPGAFTKSGFSDRLSEGSQVVLVGCRRGKSTFVPDHLPPLGCGDP